MDEAEPDKGYKYLYLSSADYMKVKCCYFVIQNLLKLSYTSKVWLIGRKKYDVQDCHAAHNILATCTYIPVYIVRMIISFAIGMPCRKCVS